MNVGGLREVFVKKNLYVLIPTSSKTNKQTKRINKSKINVIPPAPIYQVKVHNEKCQKKCQFTKI